MTLNLYGRWKAAGWHLLMSVVVAFVVVALVFTIWFPGDYQKIAGGRDLLILLVLVDLTIGPLLTFVVFNTNKGKSHLSRDIAIIVVFQFAALSYGLYSVYLARPVALVFENDRFRVISAADVIQSELAQALPEYRKLSLTGPLTMAVRKSVKGAESNDSLLAAALSGVDTSQRPKFWIPYGPRERRIAANMGRPVSQLVEKYRGASDALDHLLGDKKISKNLAVFLPVRAKTDAVVILDFEGGIIGVLPYDGYF